MNKNNDKTEKSVAIEKSMRDSYICIDALMHVSICYMPNGKINRECEHNGIIYYLRELFLDSHEFTPRPRSPYELIKRSRTHYFDFFRDNRIFKSISLYTSFDAEALLRLWEVHGLIGSDHFHIGNVMGMFKATEDQARTLLYNLAAGSYSIDMKWYLERNK